VIAVLLAASTIAGTFPVFQRGALPCSVGADSVRDRQTVRVVGQVQSPTWVAMAPAMLALPEVWAAYWPVCRAEADTFPLGTAQGRAGQKFTVTIPAGRRPTWAWAWSRNGRGDGCRGKVVVVP
jgi:hypothetical protein